MSDEAHQKERGESGAAGKRPQKQAGRIRAGPPIIVNHRGRGHRIDPSMPLHRLAADRVRNGRDLKIIITAEDSETGVGKTTLAGYLAISWTKMFTGQEWFCNPDDSVEGMATLNPGEYFEIIKQVGNTWDAGTTVIVDDAEELDARRSMQSLNVEFSQRWMLMRLKQAITIITLPSPSAIDSRLEELADVWINIQRRGRGLVHDLRVENYGSRNVLTQQVHTIEFPDVSNHPELNKLRRMKEDKMDAWEEEDEEEDDEPTIEAQAIEAKRIYDNEDCSWTDVDEIAEGNDDYMELTYSGDYLRRQFKEVIPNA
jgi:hypothetical protein